MIKGLTIAGRKTHAYISIFYRKSSGSSQSSLELQQSANKVSEIIPSLYYRFSEITHRLVVV